MNGNRASDQLIKNTNFSEEFKNTLSGFGIEKLEDLLNLSHQQLADIPNFTFHMLQEYRAFLEANNLEPK